MPRKKTHARKVKPVKVPIGDVGGALSLADKQAKLDAFVEQFDQEMENRNKEMDNECNAICQHIDNVANGLILKLTTAEAEMSVADYFKSLKNENATSRQSDEHTDLPVELQSVLSNLPELSRGGNKPPSNTASTRATKKRVPGFATPAFNKNKPQWTATPKDTPLFDKRLLNVCTGKPSGLSLNGQPLDGDHLRNLKVDDRQHLSSMLMGVINELK